jgi:hypothetical protein
MVCTRNRARDIFKALFSGCIFVFESGRLGRGDNWGRGSKQQISGIQLA